MPTLTLHDRRRAGSVPSPLEFPSERELEGYALAAVQTVPGAAYDPKARTLTVTPQTVADVLPAAPAPAAPHLRLVRP